MERPKYPHCGCFSVDKHGSDWEETLSGPFSKSEFNKVVKGTGCLNCQVKRYTEEATRCLRCEIIKSYLNCKHRLPEQLLLFDKKETRQNQ